jgi:hypothetical protein
MSVEMALDIWKWRFSGPLRIFSMSVGNDFQQPLRNEGARHFQISSISTLRGTACAGRRRLTRRVEVQSRRHGDGDAGEPLLELA